MLEEECESGFSAERILAALLRATRAKSHLFRGKGQKKDTTLNGSSVPAQRDNLAKSDIEEKEKNTTHSWYLAPNTYKKNFKSRKNASEISAFFDERMKSHNQIKSSKLSSCLTKNEKSDEPRNILGKDIKPATDIGNKEIVSEALSFEMAIREEAEVENDDPPPTLKPLLKTKTIKQ